jgi:hypothetical protein
MVKHRFFLPSINNTERDSERTSKHPDKSKLDMNRPPAIWNPAAGLAAAMRPSALEAVVSSMVVIVCFFFFVR